MSFMESLKTCFAKYVGFSGRARRSEFWWFALFFVVVVWVASFIGGMIRFPLLGTIVELALLLPYIAVGIRRMHDTGRAGWWILLPIVNLVFWAGDSAAGDNQYGPNPKGAAPTAAAPAA